MTNISLTEAQARVMFAEVNALIIEANSTVHRLQKIACVLAAATGPLCTRPVDTGVVKCSGCGAQYPAIMAPLDCAVCRRGILRG